MPNTEERAYFAARRILGVGQPGSPSALTLAQITLGGGSYFTAAEWHRRTDAVKMLLDEGLIETHLSELYGRVYQKRIGARN